MSFFKNKGGATEQGNYKGLKQLENMTKVFETVIEEIFPEMVDTDTMQFGFMPAKGTMDDIFIACQLQKSILKIRRNFFLPLWTWKIHLIGSLQSLQSGL